MGHGFHSYVKDQSEPRSSPVLPGISYSPYLWSTSLYSSRRRRRSRRRPALRVRVRSGGVLRTAQGARPGCAWMGPGMGC
jgi:hypothetical protein